MKYTVKNSEPVAFVPSILPADVTQTITNRTSHSLCADWSVRMKGLGVEQETKICILSLNGKTKIRVFGKVRIQKGQFPAPLEWREPFNTVREGFAILFDDFLLAKVLARYF